MRCQYSTKKVKDAIKGIKETQGDKAYVVTYVDGLAYDETINLLSHDFDERRGSIVIDDESSLKSMLCILFRDMMEGLKCGSITITVRSDSHRKMIESITHLAYARFKYLRDTILSLRGRPWNLIIQSLPNLTMSLVEESSWAKGIGYAKWPDRHKYIYQWKRI